MELKCVVAGANAAGIPDFFPCEVLCTKEEYSEGYHYELAITAAECDSFEGPFVVFDENDGPAWLFQNMFEKE